MVEGDGLENRCRATYREFESHPLRHQTSYVPESQSPERPYGASGLYTTALDIGIY